MTNTSKNSIHLRALLGSAAVNLAVFAALSAGFGTSLTTETALVQLPSVTIVGKRTPDSATMLSATQSSTPPCNAKL
jgi:hypothetical protein